MRELALVLALTVENWPSFRGPKAAGNADGLSLVARGQHDLFSIREVEAR